MRFEKLGPHIIQCTGPAMSWASHAGILKAIDSVEPFKVARDDAWRVFRRYIRKQDWDRPAEDIASEIMAPLDGYNHPKFYLELFNECWTDWGKLIDVVAILHGERYKVCGPSWSTGAYNEDDWEMAENSNLDAIAVHCYWGDEGLTRWHALRFLQWVTGKKRVLITECGRDAVEGGQVGWLLDGISPEQYLNELAAYDRELQKLPYVLGATVFTAGPYQGTPWVNFDTDGLAIEALANHSNNSNSSQEENMANLFETWKAEGGSGFAEDFRKHLQAIGKPDWYEIGKYGFPVEGLIMADHEKRITALEREVAELRRPFQ